MALAKHGDRVRINFTGTLEDGTIIDTTYETAGCNDEGCDCDDHDCHCEPGPMELTIGNDDFFTQVEEALIGMSPGEKRKVTIPATETFGDYDESKIFSIGRDQFPEGYTPEIGQELEFTGEDEEVIDVTVVEITDEGIVVDANHPLAGEDINYEFELVEIL